MLMDNAIQIGNWNGCAVTLWQGDITTLAVDAIVNAANAGLLGGLGVDGAIHKAGGPAIIEECRKIMRDRDILAVGEAVATGAGNLQAKHVIHVLGPRYFEPEEQDPELLTASYRNALSCARALGASSIAFPCISTGYFGYPPEIACRIAVETVKADLFEHGGLQSLVFCTFNDKDHECYMRYFGGAAQQVT